MNLSQNKAPLWISEKANILLKRVNTGRVIPRRTHGKKYQTLRVNKRWRLLSRDGTNWELLNHNDYNNLIDK
ncbi:MULTISPECIES: hypothetical protein [Brenneria]|uniref:ParE-like toxin domain-containing protein n=1 Tax=Brenneria nigrifluens DSM 30175 = ATCC 13028 TaxID=1121120 RepID=A0A2U1UIJ0_9GAMM|nr:MULTISPECIES: hypothetical protein [Brenneria]EHD21281.1 hypothetical protein BrE312_1890 [Brenneria sp. EniD312]PWC21489.1 hypothetical protein DDT54_18830 [Brenneria nigrifluens DSM 30175 = ATCC 13028]QCR04418.1 hypothetical protein EH206_09680 [Brenneria nigrifluens DSM 30175 = ATCC 13028]